MSVSEYFIIFLLYTILMNSISNIITQSGHFIIFITYSVQWPINSKLIIDSLEIINRKCKKTSGVDIQDIFRNHFLIYKFKI